MPDDEQIGETAAHRQTLRVLRQPAIAHLGKAEHTLDYQKRMLDFGAHLGLRAVLAALHFIYDAAMAVAPVGEVLGVRRVIADHVFLPPIGLIAIHPRLVAVQQPAKQLCVMHVCCGGLHRVDQLGLAVHPDVQLHPEIPLLTLPRLVHLRVPCLGFILGRTRCRDDRGIDDGAARHFQAARGQVLVHAIEQRLAEVMALQQVAEVEDRGFVGHRLAAEVDADEPAHRQRVIQRLFRRWVGQVEPVLQEVQPQHSFQANRRPAVASSWVERFNDGAQLAPGNNLVHLCQEFRAASLLAVFVEAGARQGELPHLSQLCCCGCSPIDRRVAVSRPTYSEVPYVSRHGHAFIDRALYLPKSWADDPLRLKATYVPNDIGFATKPRLAMWMIARAVASGVPFSWVAADSVYGVGEIEGDLRRLGKGYVLGVASAHVFRSWGKKRLFAGTAAEIVKTLDPSDWQRLSAGEGTKGPRLHDWCYLELAILMQTNSMKQVMDCG